MPFFLLNVQKHGAKGELFLSIKECQTMFLFIGRLWHILPKKTDKYIDPLAVMIYIAGNCDLWLNFDGIIIVPLNCRKASTITIPLIAIIYIKLILVIT